MKKIIGTIIGITSMLICFASVNASAATMEMVINEQYVVRDIVTRDGIDMLPIEDIAGELGYEYQATSTGFKLSGYYNTYTFTMGSPAVYDYWNKWSGLDIVPMIIDNKVRIPATFVSKTLGLSYTWDSVTNAIFIASPKTLNELQAEAWYKGYKKSGTYSGLSNYWGSYVPDFGDLSGLETIDYFLAEDGWTYFYYDYDKTHFEKYIEYFHNRGWEEFDEPYYDGTREVVYYFYNHGYSVNIGAYADLNESYMWIAYIPD